METMATVLVVAAVLAAAPAFLSRFYVGRLPYAPECPTCRTVTGQAAMRGLADRAWALVAATSVRHCARCGWAGRMRWRAAPERAARVHRRTRAR